MRAWILVGVGLLLAQRRYPLHPDLVLNGGFENMIEIVRRCSAEVLTPTGQTHPLLYPAFTPHYSAVGLNPYMAEYASMPAYKGRLQTLPRDLDYRHLKDPVPYLPLRYPHPRGHSILGGDLPGLEEDHPDFRPWYPYVPPRIHAPLPAWSPAETLTAERVETSFLAPLRHWTARGLAWGNTRTHLQGLFHFAPYWVSTPGHPLFFFYPELPFPPLSTTSYETTHRSFPDVMSMLYDNVGSDVFFLAGPDDTLFAMSHTIFGNNIWPTHRFDWYPGHMAHSSVGRVGQLGWRQGYPAPRWAQDTIETVNWSFMRPTLWRSPTSFPYQWLHLNRFAGPHHLLWTLAAYPNPRPTTAPFSPWFGSLYDSPEALSLGLDPLPDTIKINNAYRRAYFLPYKSVWYPAEEILESFTFQNLTAPLNEGWYWSSGSPPPEPFWYWGLGGPSYYLRMRRFLPLWRRGEPWAWMARHRLFTAGNPWYIQRAGTYGLLWELFGSLYLPPLRALGGIPQNRPLWHHTRLAQNLIQPKTAPHWHRLTVEATRPTGPCATLPPFRGQGYITLAYPLRYFHAFHSPQAYQSWLAALDARFQIRNNLAREMWFYAPTSRWAYDSLLRRQPTLPTYADSVWKAAWDTALAWSAPRCGSPTFLADPFWLTLAEVNRAWVEAMYRDLGWPEVPRDSLRLLALGRCCGTLWNARGEEGGPSAFPYDSGWGLRSAWTFGPTQASFPTGRGCPDTATLAAHSLDPDCLSQSYCIGSCPTHQYGPSSADSAAMENQAVNVAGYFFFVGRKRFDTHYAGTTSFATYSGPEYRYAPVIDVWQDSSTIYTPPQYRELSWGCTWWPSFPVDTGGAWPDAYPLISRRLPSLRWHKTTTALDVWWKGYQIGRQGCWVSFNHGPTSSCCPQNSHLVNRAYTAMGYLTEPLQPGRRYRIRLAVAVPPRSTHIIHNIGVVASTEPLPNLWPYCRKDLITKLSYSWQYPHWLSKAHHSWWENSTRLDSAVGRWIQIEGTLVAKGGERFLYLGWIDSLRLDTTPLPHDHTPFWKQGVTTCASELLPDSAWQNALDSPVAQAAAFAEGWVSADAGLHIDEVSLWDDEATPSTQGEVLIWDATCSQPAHGRIRLYTGTPPFDCLWLTPDRQRAYTGCEWSNPPPGSYQVIVLDSTGKEWRTWVEIRNLAATPPQIRLDSLWPISNTPGGAILSVVGGTPPFSFSWSHGASAQDTFLTFEPGTYEVRVLDSAGCSASLSFTIEAHNDIYMPSAFSPNGDGVNDLVGPVVRIPSRIKELRWNLYDRWGRLVFQGFGPDSRWNGTFQGKPAPEDAYTYYLWVYFLDDPKPRLLKGTITLVR